MKPTHKQMIALATCQCSSIMPGFTWWPLTTFSSTEQMELSSLNRRNETIKYQLFFNSAYRAAGILNTIGRGGTEE